jgi:hypothetical protein
MTMLCEGCQRNHESFCAKLAQLKARGAGFTVAGVPQGEHRHGHEIPPPTPPDRPREEPVDEGPRNFIIGKEDSE